MERLHEGCFFAYFLTNSRARFLEGNIFQKLAPSAAAESQQRTERSPPAEQQVAAGLAKFGRETTFVRGLMGVRTAKQIALLDYHEGPRLGVFLRWFCRVAARVLM